MISHKGHLLVTYFEEHLLHEAISPTPTGFILLQLNKFEFAERLKNILEVTFSDTEMNVTHIQPVKGSRVIVVGAGFGIASLAVLFSLSQLSDDRDS